MDKRIPSLVFILIVLIHSPAWALPEDENQSAMLAANSADLNQQIHRGDYEGDVKFDQGTRHLRASRATTEGDENNKLRFAIVYGNKEKLAHYWEKTSINKPLMHAWAQEIRYYPQKHRLELVGNAKVTQGKDSFSAPYICYDIQKQHVSTQQQGEKRTLIIIHPRKQHE